MEERPNLEEEVLRPIVIASAKAMKKKQMKVEFKSDCPPDLTESYEFVAKKRFTSEIYSTDAKPDKMKKIDGFSILLTYDLEEFIRHLAYERHGKDVNKYIQFSLQKKIEEEARDLEANLVILHFTNQKLFKYRVYRVEGLGKRNYQGQVTARFYKKKK